jgi:hypothetical protein
MSYLLKVNLDKARSVAGSTLILVIMSLLISPNRCQADPNPTIESQLKNAVEDAQKNIPALEGWQKILFTDEVVPQFQRFIQDYRPTSSGLKVVVDYDSLKHYLLFYGPKVFKQPNPKILVYTKVDPLCPKCTESQPAVLHLLKSRLERRGLTPIWVSTEELGPQSGGKREGNQLEDFIVSLAKKKNAVGALIVRLAPAPAEDSDTAHADEKRYILRTYMQMGDVSMQDRQKEVLDNDNFEQSEARLLTDIFADLGAKYELQQAIAPESGRAEVLVEITGIQDFAQYTRVKSLMAGQLRDISSLEERMLSKDQIVFAVFTKRSAEDIRNQLSRLTLDPGSPKPLGVVVR